MSFLSRTPKGLIYVSRTSLKLYLRGTTGSLDMPLDASVVSNLQVKNQEKLNAAIKTFLATSKLQPQRLMVLLSEELLFHKTFNVSKEASKKKSPDAATKSIESKLDDKITKFLEEVPFIPSNVASVNILTKTGTLVAATNSLLYKGIVQGLERTGWQVSSVVPELAFNKGTMSVEYIKQILNSRDVVKVANFLDEKTVQKHVVQAEFSKKEKAKGLRLLDNKKVKNVGAVVLFVLLISISVGLLAYNGIVPLSLPFLKPQDIPVSEETTPPPVEIADVVQEVEEEKEPSVEYLEKNEISIQVLNGTGVAGLATQIQDELIALGYEDIVIGNAEVYGSSETILLYAENVHEDFVEELDDLLVSLFDDVSTELFEIVAEEEELDEDDVPDEDGLDIISEDAFQSFDILITTGLLLTN